MRSRTSAALLQVFSSRRRTIPGRVCEDIQLGLTLANSQKLAANRQDKDHQSTSYDVISPGISFSWPFLYADHLAADDQCQLHVHRKN